MSEGGTECEGMEWNGMGWKLLGEQWVAVWDLCTYGAGGIFVTLVHSSRKEYECTQEHGLECCEKEKKATRSKFLDAVDPCNNHYFELAGTVRIGSAVRRSGSMAKTEDWILSRSTCEWFGVLGWVHFQYKCSARCPFPILLDGTQTHSCVPEQKYEDKHTLQRSNTQHHLWRKSPCLFSTAHPVLSFICDGFSC